MDFYFAVEFFDYFLQATGKIPLEVGREEEEKIEELLEEAHVLQTGSAQDQQS